MWCVTRTNVFWFQYYLSYIHLIFIYTLPIDIIDIWSIGVITYLLFCGETPFGGCSGEPLLQVRSNILSGKFVFEPKEAWESVSDLGKDFVKTLLTVDPKARLTAKQAQRHPWIQTFSRKKECSSLNPNVVKALVSFKELSDMQKLLSEVLSFSLLPEQITDLREEFAKVDNGDGEITLEDLKKVLIENAEAGALGALTEEEVEDIFQALRVRKTEQTIRWHEFIAAGLSQCEVDDRNLRLAFNRLDTDGKGFITLKDFMELMGASHGDKNAEYLKEIWTDTAGSSVDCITFDDFLMLMKGQEPVEAPAARVTNINRTAIESIPEEGYVISENAIEREDFSRQIMYRKMRSRSMDHTPKRVSLLTQQHKNIGNVIKDDSKSPLVVNRSLYRAHRDMRLAVLEASKRFEEKRAKRQENDGAALPMMRRESTVASSSSWNKKAPSDQQIKLVNACHRGGRSMREKTVSDVSGLF